MDDRVASRDNRSGGLDWRVDLQRGGGSRAGVKSRLEPSLVFVSGCPLRLYTIQGLNPRFRGRISCEIMQIRVEKNPTKMDEVEKRTNFFTKTSLQEVGCDKWKDHNTATPFGS